MLDLADRPTIASRPWLAQDDPGVPDSLDYPAARLDGLLRRTARRYPNRPALIFYLDRLLAEIERRRVTFFPGVPTLYVPERTWY